MNCRRTLHWLLTVLLTLIVTGTQAGTVVLDSNDEKIDLSKETLHNSPVRVFEVSPA